MKGKVLTKHRNLPTEEQDEAMSDYVDSLNLMTYKHDDEGYPLPPYLYLTFEVPSNIFVRKILTPHSSIESIKSLHTEQSIPMIQSLHHPIS
jgi:hypothetical protein